ncbi:hypothetical protein C8R44DRAFT_797217 [Mycena epipterygia]|nr:hypothetical protein C8R44DRAFT_797217 [Mycena epipterygia]
MSSIEGVGSKIRLVYGGFLTVPGTGTRPSSFICTRCMNLLGGRGFLWSLSLCL